MEETVSIKQILEILRKHLASILVSMFLGLAVAAIVTFFVITPKYSSQAQLIVTLPQNENTNVNDVNTNLQMINTYKDLITGDLVMNTVKDRIESEYNIDMSVAEIREEIQVIQSQNSQMFSIRATDIKAINAERISNVTAQVFQENAKDVMNVDKISIISNAQASMTPVSPNNKVFLAAGLALGTLLGIVLAFLLELLDRTVKDDQFVTETLGFTILGTVPQMSQKELEASIHKQSIVEVPVVKKVTDKSEKESRRSRSRV